MRVLASIRKVAMISPIPGADAIELLAMEGMGWQCVVRKGTFKPGDLCVFFEIDSLLPNIPQFSFFSKGQKLKKSIIDTGTEVEGYRLKSARLRGAFSQGLALPLSEFQGILPESCEIGTDVSALIGVYKYDPPVPVHLAGELKGAYPGLLAKTDEIRMQSDTSVLDKYRGQRFYCTSKLDGTSSTFFKYENEFGVCGHRWEYKENEKNTFWRLANKYNLKDKFPEGFAVQGEVAGESIQSNRIKLKGVDFYGFYVIDIKKNQYLKLDDMQHFLNDLGLKMVPVVNDNLILDHTVEELLKMADASSPLNPNEIQEGLVFRLYDSMDKVTFKVISNAYIDKWGL
jgi:RNA ligase (TIGR02306 family)